MYFLYINVLKDEFLLKLIIFMRYIHGKRKKMLKFDEISREFDEFQKHLKIQILFILFNNLI